MTCIIKDALGRALLDLRISVIDACNFRCSYCMPADIFGKDFAFLKRKDLLSFEEIQRLVRLFSQLGVEKIRITGGEPLLRKNLEELIVSLANISGIQDLALTTNGYLLAEKATMLKAAGLRRVTVSLDALTTKTFKKMSGVDEDPQRVLDGINAALEAGFDIVKVNMVVKRGINEEDILPMARLFKGTKVVLRYIEYMDVGNANQWHSTDVVTAQEILEKIHQEMPLVPFVALKKSDVAQQYCYVDGEGDVGVIASITQPFCGHCVRARISADGMFYTCLFAETGTDLKSPLRAGASDADMLEIIQRCWQKRTDRYSEFRSTQYLQPKILKKVEMFKMGG